MEIKKTYDDAHFSKKSQLLGNCYILITENKIFHYEFVITGTNALIQTDGLEYIEIMTDWFHNQNKWIITYSTPDHNFYKVFDPPFTFLLPTSILQVSSLFLDEEKIKEMDATLNCKDIPLAVSIMDDEYVIIDGHHRLYTSYLNHIKMVPVYVTNPPLNIDDILYYAKEQHIWHIEDLQVVSHKDYLEYLEQLELLRNIKF